MKTFKHQIVGAALGAAASLATLAGCADGGSGSELRVPAKPKNVPVAEVLGSDATESYLLMKDKDLSQYGRVFIRSSADGSEQTVFQPTPGKNYSCNQDTGGLFRIWEYDTSTSESKFHLVKTDDASQRMQLEGYPALVFGQGLKALDSFWDSTTFRNTLNVVDVAQGTRTSVKDIVGLPQARSEDRVYNPQGQPLVQIVDGSDKHLFAVNPVTGEIDPVGIVTSAEEVLRESNDKVIVTKQYANNGARLSFYQRPSMQSNWSWTVIGGDFEMHAINQDTLDGLLSFYFNNSSGQTPHLFHFQPPSTTMVTGIPPNHQLDSNVVFGAKWVAARANDKNNMDAENIYSIDKATGVVVDDLATQVGVTSCDEVYPAVVQGSKAVYVAVITPPQSWERNVAVYFNGDRSVRPFEVAIPGSMESRVVGVSPDKTKVAIQGYMGNNVSRIELLDLSRDSYRTVTQTSQANVAHVTDQGNVFYLEGYGSSTRLLEGNQSAGIRVVTAFPDFAYEQHVSADGKKALFNVGQTLDVIVNLETGEQETVAK